jgi:ataxia telangiectasia mutated family protein
VLAVHGVILPPPVKTSSPSKSGRTVLPLTEWEQAWNFAIRHLHNPATCRAAAHAAHLLVTYERIDNTKIISDVEGLVRDLDTQGPSFPFDAVCDFLCCCLEFAAHDVRLFRLELPEKVLAWLTTTWKPFEASISTKSSFRNRARTDVLDIGSILRLFARVCSLVDVPTIETEVLLPDCAISRAMQEHCDSAEMRTYLLNASLPPYRPAKSQPRGSSVLAREGDQLPPNGVQRRLSAFLERSLTAAYGEGEEGDDAYWTALPIDNVRQHYRVVTVALLFEASLQCNGIRANRGCLVAASQIIARLTPCLRQARWSPSERAWLFLTLAPLFPTLDVWRTTRFVGLVDPCLGSDIRRSSLPSSASDSRLPNEAAATSTLLCKLWLNTDLQASFEGVLDVFRDLLKTPPEAQIHENDDDGFGAVRAGSSSQLPVTSSHNENAVATCISTCVRGIVTLSLFKPKPSQAASQTDVLVDCLVNGSGAKVGLCTYLLHNVLVGLTCTRLQVLAVGGPIFDAILGGRLRFDVSDYNAILDKFGEELLPSYDFGRSEGIQLLTLRFLEATAPLWVNDSSATSEFTLNTRRVTDWFIEQLAKCRIFSWRIRLNLLALLDLTVRLDPSSSAFDDPETEDGVLPVTVIPSLIGDPDFHVRYHVSSCVAHLFEISQSENSNIDKLWIDVRDHVPRNLDEFEICVTAFLVLANIMIVSGRARRAPFEEILVMARASQAAALDPSRYDAHLESVLTGVAARLGLHDLAEFYCLFAGHVTRRAIVRKQEHLRLPDRLCGFRTRKECVAATFKETGAAFLADDKASQFESQCKVLGKSRSAGIRECLPMAAADILVRGVNRGLRKEDPDESAIPEASNRTVQLALEADLGTDANAVLSCMADQLLAEILACHYEPDCTVAPNRPLLAVIQDLPKAAKAISRMLAKAPSVDLYSPCPPYSDTYDIFHACKWLDQETNVFKRPAAIYSTLHRLFTMTVQKPFINDQLRHLYAIALCLAMTGAWTDSTTLRMVIHALTILHRQPELAPLTRSMLEWAVTTYLSLPALTDKSDTWLPTILANAARAAHSHIHSTDEAVRLSGLELLDFLEARLRELSARTNQKSQTQAVRAALLWPRGDILTEAPDLAVIHETLEAPTAKTHMFHLARSLTRAKGSTPPEAGKIGWRILASCSSLDHVDLEDSLAFVDFLFSNRGAIYPPTLRDVAPAAVRSKRNAAKADDVRASLVSLVLPLMRDNDLKLVDLAANTLRTIYALGLDASSLPIPVDDELNLLAASELARSFEARRSPHHAWDELTSVEWLKKGEKGDEWLRDFTTFLADVQGGTEPFYSQLVPLLARSPEFAKDALALLVHSVLHREISQKGETARVHLSQYFGSLLGHLRTDIRAIRDVIDIVNYLRQHPQPGSRSILSADLWLQLDWNNLAEAAARCGRHHDCLLFLELAREHGGVDLVSGSGKSPDATRQLLYEIYAHVDDPDGFYGIQSNDFKETVIQRYHHEKRWSLAFQIHAADYESSHLGSTFPSSSATLSVVNSLAASGFYRLALSILHPGRASGRLEETTATAGLPYELAWRTQQWDLPLEQNAQNGSSAALFTALRAVHRDRDQSAAMQALEASIVKETRKAATVSADLPMPNREALVTLLSLREVRMWRRECSQHDGLPQTSKGWLKGLEEGFR